MSEVEDRFTKLWYEQACKLAEKLSETADRIEKLEAALREIEYLDRPQVRGLPRRIEIYDIARKALEGKDD